MKNFYVRLTASLMITFGLTFTAPSAVSADPADVFPAGPYTATLISAKILYPSLFGVAAGLPVADVSGVQLPNGTTRAYVFAQIRAFQVVLFLPQKMVSVEQHSSSWQTVATARTSQTW